MFYLIFISLLAAQCNGLVGSEKEKCDQFQANFSLKEIIGSWHVVAIVPDEKYPKNHTLICYRLDFSETDVGGLRWLVNNTLHRTLEVLDEVEGSILRQRYHSRQPFDVWSKAVEGVNGCFQQVLSLNYSNTEVMNEVNTGNPVMQLHIMKTTDGRGKLLLQMLWSKTIAGVIYSKNKEVSPANLSIVLKLMSKLRGPQRNIKMCDVMANL